MTHYGNKNCGPFGRHSIDNVPGFPIIVEDFVIPVFKGSTLTTEFQFPFDLLNTDVVSIVDGSPIELDDAVVTQINDNTVSVTWSSDIIDDLESDNNSFRVRVDRADGTVKTYNEISIRIF